MSTQPHAPVDGIVREAVKWTLTAVGALLTWLGGSMLSDIKNGLHDAVAAQIQMTTKLAAIEEKLSASNASDLHQSAQIESVRAELIDLRMRVNTLETKIH